MSDDAFSHFLTRIEGGGSLARGEAARVFGMIMDGNVRDPEMAALLTALARRKPAVEEVVGAAEAMRERMIAVEGVEGAIDLCGTGGDGLDTLNVSTACAFVVAGAGVPVAKHGNRSMSSKTGAADVIEALGAKIDLDAARAANCLTSTGVCFLFAQAHHPAMKHAGPVRRALGFRTILNLLGPLANPADVKRQLVGVYDEDAIDTIAQALRRLGTQVAWVVHGEDGLDEISIAGATNVAIVDGGQIVRKRIVPEDAGLARTKLEAIRGGTPKENARALEKLLEGERGAYRDVVLLNASAALCVSGKAANLEEGVAVAATSIDTGCARAKLHAFVRQTQS